jgi:flagellin-like protein
MVERKGISPMIAIVLLIAFTVAVGGILSLWLTTLTSTQTTTTGSAAEKQVLCARSVLEITEVYYENPQSANVTVSYTYGTESLTGFNLFFVDYARNSENKTASGTLTPGDSETFAITSLSTLSATGTYQSVRVIAMCQNTYPVSGECKSGQSCMNQY